MAMKPRVGEAFIETDAPITGDDPTLGVVDFSIFPPPGPPGFHGQDNGLRGTMGVVHRRSGLRYRRQTAIKVIDGEVEVVSEGHWRYFGA